MSDNSHTSSISPVSHTPTDVTLPAASPSPAMAMNTLIEIIMRHIRYHEDMRLRQLSYVEHFQHLRDSYQQEGSLHSARWSHKSANICADHVRYHEQQVRRYLAVIYRMKGGC